MDLDDELDELIANLLVRAGTLMEDFSVMALRRLPGNDDDRAARLRDLALGGVAIASLAVAAWSLPQLGESPGAVR